MFTCIDAVEENELKENTGITFCSAGNHRGFQRYYMYATSMLNLNAENIFMCK